MDEDLHAKIEALVAEEHELRQRHTSSAEANAALDDDERARMSSVEVQLDRTWDLLRQRGARRRAGQDPEATHERPAGEVEGYTG